MLEPPDIPADALLAAVRASFGIPITALAFLPVGNDASAWVYRAAAEGGVEHFLKVRRGPVNEASLAIPRYLQAQGVPHIVAPILTQSDSLWGAFEKFALILYPYIDGQTGMARGLSDRQWIEYGATLRRLHNLEVPPELAPIIRQETFRPKWSATIVALDGHIGARTFSNDDERALAEFWRPRRAEILRMAERADGLGRRLARRTGPLVVCHADAHTANILIDAQERLWIVDWDEALMAPKERDLMFVVGDDSSDPTSARSAQLFLQGYGPIAIDRLALAYYRYEWAVQEVGDFGARVFLQSEAGAETKHEAVDEFRRLFQPGRDVDTAYQSDQEGM